jgi:hypothetical protein
MQEKLENEFIFMPKYFFFSLIFSLIMPKANMVQKSGFKFNITEPFVDIRYTGTGSAFNCISLFKILIISIIITLNSL